jgi:hypothetical protein
MDKEQILARLHADLPQDALLDSAREDLRVVVRLAFDFAEFLLRLPEAEEISANVDRVAKRITQGIEMLSNVNSVADDIAVAISDDALEDLEYTNGSTVGATECFVKIRELALQIVHDTPPRPLKWLSYPSVKELKEEFFIHLEVIKSQEATAQERVTALLHTSRLQIIFLANTLC